MQTTKLSSKGQVIIPMSLRQGMDEGTSFTVARKDNLIILKKIEGLTKEEEQEMKELQKIWKDIDEGKGLTLTKEEFFKEMETW